MRVVLVGALNGAFAVAAGAFGAHLLDGRVTVADGDLFQMAVYYQAIHAAVLVAMGALKNHVLDSLLFASSWAMALGTILFSAALYCTALGGPQIISMAAPIGGGLLLLGWLLVAVAAARKV